MLTGYSSKAEQLSVLRAFCFEGDIWARVTRSAEFRLLLIFASFATVSFGTPVFLVIRKSKAGESSTRTARWSPFYIWLLFLLKECLPVFTGDQALIIRGSAIAVTYAARSTPFVLPPRALNFDKCEPPRIGTSRLRFCSEVLAEAEYWSICMADSRSASATARLCLKRRRWRK